MNSLILQTATRFLLTLITLYSVFLLIRGHNYPGGGFIGGLAASGAWALYGIAFGPASVRKSLGCDLASLVGLGLLLAVVSGLFGISQTLPFLSGQWRTIPLPGGSSFKLGSPLLFDLGVYLVVFGTVLRITLNLEEED